MTLPAAHGAAIGITSTRPHGVAGQPSFLHPELDHPFQGAAIDAQPAAEFGHVQWFRGRFDFPEDLFEHDLGWIWRKINWLEGVFRVAYSVNQAFSERESLRLGDYQLTDLEEGAHTIALKVTQTDGTTNDYSYTVTVEKEAEDEEEAAFPWWIIILVVVIVVVVVVVLIMLKKR